jgi:hypothetical protein
VCEPLPLTWTLEISKPALAVDDPSTQRRLLVALYSTFGLNMSALRSPSRGNSSSSMWRGTFWIAAV